MYKSILENVVRPLATRIGTAVAAGLGGYALAEPSLAHDVGGGVAAALLIGFDLVAAYIARRKLVEKTKREA